MLNEETPGVEEEYSTAMTSSNLRIDISRRSQADAIIAAGWNKARIGAALMRLHTQFDAAAKPKPMGPDAIKRLAGSVTIGQIEPMVKQLGIDIGALRPAAAVEAISRAYAQATYMKDMRDLLDKLTDFPAVRDQLAREVKSWGSEDEEAVEMAIEVVRWWLSPRCTVCHGTKWQLVPGTNRLSNHACRKCRGKGEADIPYDGKGKRLLGWMNECRGSARGSMHASLRNSMGRD